MNYYHHRRECIHFNSRFQVPEIRANDTQATVLQTLQDSKPPDLSVAYNSTDNTLILSQLFHFIDEKIKFVCDTQYFRQNDLFYISILYRKS